MVNAAGFLVKLLIVLAAQDDRPAKLYKKISFPPDKEIAEWRARSDEHKRVLDVVLKREHWVGAFKAIEEKLGPFSDDLTIEVRLADWDSTHPAIGHATGAKGYVKFNMRRLSEYQRKLDELEKQKKELAKDGKRMVFKVPPMKFERIIYHELTHVLQAGFDAPDWFNEGMASWLGDDSNYLYAYAHAGKTVDDIEAKPAEEDDVYGRGMLFFKWLESKLGKEGMKKLGKATLLDHGAWKESLEKATGLEWGKLKDEEKVWSAKKLSTYGAKD